MSRIATITLKPNRGKVCIKLWNGGYHLTIEIVMLRYARHIKNQGRTTNDKRDSNNQPRRTWLQRQHI